MVSVVIGRLMVEGRASKLKFFFFLPFHTDIWFPTEANIRRSDTIIVSNYSGMAIMAI
jgi:hypothetical protein